jgi:hypothetical protein
VEIIMPYANIEDRRANQKRYYEANKARCLAQSQQWREDNPEHCAYFNQKSSADARGVEWLFTFETWMDWWGADYARRGRKGDDLCMARRGDKGPYSPENCVKLNYRTNAKHGSYRRMLNERRQGQAA